MNWIGPYTIDGLLDLFLAPSQPRPPESKGVYVVSEKEWFRSPTKNCEILYVGSNTGKSKRFRTRIGDLIADMFGFFGEETGHHSGGIALNKYCQEKIISPKNLYIGWTQIDGCVRCAENQIYDDLRPKLCSNRPPRCKLHACQGCRKS